jgi:elongation factor G
LKQLPPNDHRKVAIIGHGGSGKTLLAEALLFRTKTIPRMGSIAEGTTALDYHVEEVKKHSVYLGVATFEYGGKRITLLDTPGFLDFEGELATALAAADSVMVVVSAESGVEIGTELAWKRSRRRSMPASIVINGMDKEKANHEAAVASVQEKFGKKAVPMQIPFGSGSKFTGVIDVLRNQAIKFRPDGPGEKGPVPPEFADDVVLARAALMESAAESSEELMAKYFDAGELTQDELIRGIHEGIAQGDFYPVFFTSSHDGHGITQLLDGMVDLFPGTADRPPVEGVHPVTEIRETRPSKIDGPLAAQVFKVSSEPHVGEIYWIVVRSGVLTPGLEVYNATQDRSEKVSQLFFAVGKNRVDAQSLSAGDIGFAVKLRNARTNDTLCDRSAPIKLDPITFPAPVIDFAIHAVNSGDEDKMGTALGRIAAEDPTFRHHYDEASQQSLVSGMGETHLHLIVAKMKERYGVAVELATPRIPFRETIKGKATVQGRYKKQTGGRGQFGYVHIKLEPLPHGGGFEFVDAIVGGSVPNRFIPAVEKGIVESMARGVIAGYPFVDVRATLFDGSYHTVDSSEAAFKVAGSMAFKKAVTEAKPTLLEPFLQLRVTVPKEYMGDVMGDLSSKRGKILGMEADGDAQVIQAQVPMAEVQRYAIDLRSITQGRGSFERKFSHYEELPRELQEKVIADAKFVHAAEE